MSARCCFRLCGWWIKCHWYVLSTYSESIELIGVEAGGLGSGLGQCLSLATGTPGVLQGAYTIILQNKDGQVQETHSISAGLDYSGVGPEHAIAIC